MDVRSATRVSLPAARTRGRGRTRKADGQRTRAPETAPAWRVLRGNVVGTAATALAVAGHQMAGGAAPAASAAATAAVLVGAASIALSRLRWTLPRLLALLLVTQPGLHALFVWSRPDTHPHVHAPMPGPGEQASTLEHVAALLPAGPAMTAGHALAAVGTAVLLARGEAWLCGVLDALALRAVRLLLALLPVYGAGPVPVPVPTRPPPRRLEPADAWSPRGPPR